MDVTLLITVPLPETVLDMKVAFDGSPAVETFTETPEEGTCALAAFGEFTVKATGAEAGMARLSGFPCRSMTVPLTTTDVIFSVAASPVI